MIYYFHNVQIRADKLQFESGQGLLDFASEAKISLKAEDVVQSLD